LALSKSQSPTSTGFPFHSASLRLNSFQGGSSPLGQLRLHLSELAQSSGACYLILTLGCPIYATSGKLSLTTKPHFLWITEFPLFTRSDGDKEFLAGGRWSSTHHPFTAPMWQDIEALYRGDVEGVRSSHSAEWHAFISPILGIRFADSITIWFSTGSRSEAVPFESTMLPCRTTFSPMFSRLVPNPN
jgi:hypothetical protein